MTSQIQSDTQISGAAVAVFLVFLAAGLALAAVFGNRLPIFAGVLAGLYCLLAIKVADQRKKSHGCGWGDTSACAVRGCFSLFPSSTVSAGASISACG